LQHKSRVLDIGVHTISRLLRCAAQLSHHKKTAPAGAVFGVLIKTIAINAFISVVSGIKLLQMTIA
jgi:hypothetical protein